MGPIGNVIVEGKTKELRIGAELAKVNSLGFRKLLITIKKEDEGKVVDLF